MSSEIIIRKGTKADLPQVLERIRELAVYERCPDEVSNTVEQMEIDGFGARPIFGLVVAERESTIIGIAIHFYKYSTWKGKCIYLEDILVKEEYRRQGIGTLLFKEMIAVSKSENAQRLEWQVLDWNTSAIDFYKKFDASFDGEWINGRLTAGQIRSF